MKAGRKTTLFLICLILVVFVMRQSQERCSVELCQNSPQHQVNIGRVEEQLQTLIGILFLPVRVLNVGDLKCDSDSKQIMAF